MGDGRKLQEQRDLEKSVRSAGLFTVIPSQVQPGPRRETAPSTGSQRAAGAAWGRRKLRGLGRKGGHIRAGQPGAGGPRACRLPSQFSPPCAASGMVSQGSSQGPGSPLPLAPSVTHSRAWGCSSQPCNIGATDPGAGTATLGDPDPPLLPPPLSIYPAHWVKTGCLLPVLGKAVHPHYW